MIPLLFIPFPHALFFLALFLLTIKEKLFLLNPREIGRSYIQNNPYRNNLPPPIAIVSLFAIIHPKKLYQAHFFSTLTPHVQILAPFEKGLQIPLMQEIFHDHSRFPPPFMTVFYVALLILHLITCIIYLFCLMITMPGHFWLIHSSVYHSVPNIVYSTWNLVFVKWIKNGFSTSIESIKL